MVEYGNPLFCSKPLEYLRIYFFCFWNLGITTQLCRRDTQLGLIGLTVISPCRIRVLHESGWIIKTWNISDGFLLGWWINMIYPSWSCSILGGTPMLGNLHIWYIYIYVSLNIPTKSPLKHRSWTVNVSSSGQPCQWFLGTYYINLYHIISQI